jgi:iron complex transport system ATP-binding protein
MQGGRTVVEGPPARVMTPAVVRAVFGIDSQVVIDPISETPMIVPIGRHHRARMAVTAA